MDTSFWSRLSRRRVLDRESVDTPDYDFGLKAFRVLDLLAWYFRVEVGGLDNVPEGPAVMVGNHNSGITFFDPMFLGVAWYRYKKGDEFVYLVHDAMLATPGLGAYLRKMGAARASTRAATEALTSGRKIMVFPGGNHEAFRPFKDRYKIDMGRHRGFCKLALRHHVPVVPVVGVGSHETFFVLARGSRIARATGLDKLLRIESFPLILSLPWGLSMGPVFHFPLPAKITITVGEPIPVDDFPPDAADDPAAVDALFHRVANAMQAIMDNESARRRWPVVG